MGLKLFIKNWLLPPAFAKIFAKPIQPAIQSKPINDFVEKTKLIKNRHTGKRCFVLGAGSSIKQQDIKKLAGEYVISVSNTFVHPDFELIKPQYHALSHIMAGHSHLYTAEKFVEWLKEMDAKLFDAEMFMHYGDKQLIDDNKIFEKRKIHWVEYVNWDEKINPPIDPAHLPKIWSVSELAVTMAIYMGFDKIYLLGFDHDWFNGPMVYFYDKKIEHKIQPKDEDLTYVDSEYQMRRHAYIFKKYKYLYSLKKNIYNANANPNTYVDVFPKVDYDSLFND